MSKKKRPKKKKKGRAGGAPRQQVWRNIDWLPQLAYVIDGPLGDIEEQVRTFTKAHASPGCLDDSTVNRAMKVHREGLEFCDHHREQLLRWKAQPTITPAQLQEVDRLLAANEKLREATARIVDLLKEIKGETIEAIMAKDPGELAMEILSGNRKAPEPLDQATMLDDFLPKMPLPELTTQLQRARAAFELQRVVEEVGGREQLWLHPDVVASALACKAIMRSADLVELTDLRERFPGFEAFMLAVGDIRMAIEQGKIALP